MARQDWEVLQKQFIAERAKTKISLEDWCKANGYNYNTARRYIKLTAQEHAQFAQKKVRSAQSAQKIETSAAPDARVCPVTVFCTNQHCYNCAKNTLKR